MRYIADFHIHSHYSRATSKNLNLESLYQWARIKGINVIGTGDFTHPLWIQEMEEKLEPAGNGLLRLKNPPKEQGLPNIKPKDIDIFFCLSTEISSIYKYGDRVRKNHNVVTAPDFDTAKRINARLAEIGNLASDGRPILGLPSRDLLEIVLETSEDAHLVPAHVWTPWFSSLGSKAGYDSIEECFRDLSSHIFALETGLSSDPLMNWKLSSLDKYALISNSDAHSPQKLGREANIFDTELSYYDMFKALKTKRGFSGTYEFFPEEGKYHLDGHRKCNISMEPQESLRHNNICPVCGKPLTIGVLHRVEELADRNDPLKPQDSPEFEYIIPLPEIIAGFTGTTPAAKKVQQTFTQIISSFGNEFDLLHTIPVEEIRSKSGELLAEAIRRLRGHEVKPQAGYDGEYGVISIFSPGETARITGQADIFGELPVGNKTKRKPVYESPKQITRVVKEENGVLKPNEEQLSAIRHEGNIIVTAGPGTGKTSTLIHHIAHQIEQKGIDPDEIIAITFTNKAADELRDRLQKQIGEKADGILIGTFHAIAYRFLKEIKPETTIIYDKNNRISLLKMLFNESEGINTGRLSRAYEEYNEAYLLPEEKELLSYFETYDRYLSENNAVDLSAIIKELNSQLKSGSGNITANYRVLAVDEFQDINPAQYEFIKLISKNKQVFAIGDPNQSIYGFRGSDIRLFYRAKEDLNATEVFLRKNYRTPKKILDAGNMLISHNRYRAKVNPESVKNTDMRIKYFIAEDSRQEASYIADSIIDYVGGVDYLSTGQTKSDYNYAFSDMAVLYRTHYIGDEIVRRLKQKGIPVLLSDGTSFLSEAPFNIISYALQLIQNKSNVIAFSDLAERLLGLNKSHKQELLKQYSANEADPESFFQDKRWKQWISLYNSLYAGFEKGSLKDTIQQLLDFFIPESELSEQQQIKREMIIKLAAESDKHPGEYLQKNILSPYTDAGRIKSGGVSLMTFHAAKGLEFPVVFIAGAEEGVSPVVREDTDIEEERRLFYVAMTRAKEELQIIRSGKRRYYGRENEMMPSRFLDEFDKEYLQLTDFEKKDRNITDEQQLSLF